MKVSFGDFVFDSEARQLKRGGRPLDLSPKAFALFEALLECRPKALRREELRDRLWPRTFVAHTALARVVNEARAALGEGRGRSGWIRTVHGYGYAWADQVTEGKTRSGAGAPKGASLYRLIWGSREIALEPGDNELGRSHETGVFIDSALVSRRHARIVIAGNRATIEDCGSKNGTLVGGRKIEAPTGLKDGDEIRLGSALLVFRAFPEAGSTRTAGS
jgi:DNA-binding winged helix-turn-helix (wHTH) protein